MMKNVTNARKFVLLHSFGNIGGLILSPEEKKATIPGCNREPVPITMRLDTLLSLTQIQVPVPNDLQKIQNTTKLTRFTNLYPVNLETLKMPMVIPVPPLLVAIALICFLFIITSTFNMVSQCKY